MRMKLFRDKLAQEIKEAEAMIHNNEARDQRIQAHIYCISALLRKIMTRIDGALGVKVKAREIPYKTNKHSPYNDISLKRLNDTILHYSEFLPSLFTARVEARPGIKILSDKDSQLMSREVYVEDFLEAATDIAENGELIVDGVLRYAKKCLSKTNHSGITSKLMEAESAESLIDTFDLIRELEREGWIDGSITLFKDKRNPSNIIEVVGLFTAEVGYNTLFSKLFAEWNYIPFRQFTIYEEQDFGLNLQGKRVIRIESYGDDGLTVGSIIRLEDMIAMLHTMEKTPFSASKLQSPPEQQTTEKVLWT